MGKIPVPKLLLLVAISLIVICNSNAYSFTTTPCDTTAPILIKNRSLTLCQGELVRICDSLGRPLHWSNGYYGDTVSIGTTGNYEAFYSDSTGCITGKSNIEVYVNPKPYGVGLDYKSQQCGSDSSIVKIAGNKTGLSFLWDDGTTDSTVWLTSQQRSVTITNNYGCYITATTNSQIAYIPSIVISGYNNVCPNSPTTLNIINNSPVQNLVYNWSNGTIGTSSTYTLSNSTNIYNYFSYNGCTRITYFQINTFPTQSITITAPDSICLGTSSSASIPWSTYYNVVWNTGQTNNTISISPTTNTTYTVTAQGSYGCTVSGSKTIKIKQPPTITFTGDTIFCYKDTLNITAHGGDHYIWNNGDTTTSIATTNFNQLYVTGYGSNGCSTKAYPPLTFDFSANPQLNTSHGKIIVCPGESITIGDISSTPNTHLWNTGDTTATISVQPQNTTTYFLTTTSIYGCTISSKIEVEVASASSHVLPSQYVVFYGIPDAIYSATNALSYSWSNGDTISHIQVPINGPSYYTLTTTYSGGCSITDTCYVIKDSLPKIIGPNQVCSGIPYAFSISGGINYIWNNLPDTTNTIITSFTFNEPLSATVTTPHHRIVDISKNISVTGIGGYNIIGRDSICKGDTILLFTGNQANDIINWSTGSTNDSIYIPIDSTTTITLTVTNSSGCTSIKSKTIKAINDTLNINITGDTLICGNEMATLTASGGINYKWNTGATVPQIHVSPIEGQTYSVESTSKNGCIVAIDSVSLHKIQTLPVAISGDQLLCDGDTSILSVDQSLNNVYWNTGDYSNAITINPDQTTIYNVIAIDSITGCVGTDSAIVTVNHGANGNGALCYYYINTCNPYYYIVVQGNNSNSITWSDGQIGDEITTTSATAISSVTYSNNNGCSDYTEQVSIDTSINAQSVIFVGDTLVCQGATVRVLTGTNGFPITGYLWSTGSTNYYTDVTVLGDTTISAIVYLDSCFKTGSYTIHTLKDTIAPIWAPDSLCINNTGTNLYTIQGGQSYLWSSGSTSFYSPLYGSQVANQTYNLTITYKGGCTRKGSKTVHFFQPETFNIIGDSIVCPGDTIELIADNPNFNYTWYSSNGTHYQNDTLLFHPETNESFSIYAGYANPTKTCMLNKNFTVSINQNHDIKINGSDIACNGDSIIFTSSDSQYDLLWQDGSTNDTLIVFPNNNDIISLQGTSACGTVSYDSILVNIVSGSLSLNYDITICQTNQPIIISTMHQGNYLWYNGSNDSSISLLASTDTTIFVDITLPSGCNIREYHNIHFFQESILSYPSTVAICEGASTTLRVLGSNNIIWSNGFTSPVILVSPLSSTWYSFTSTSLNGCIRHDSIYVQVLSKPNLTLTGQNFCCSGSYVNFYSNISPTLANQTYSYLWFNGLTTRDCITQISTPQNISLTVTSSNGCSSTATKFIQTDYYPVAISGATKICKYSSTTLSINPLDYPSGSLFSWNTGDSTSSITVSPTSTHSYTVFIKLANACVISKEIIVEVSTTPQIFASSNSPCIGDTVIIKSTTLYNTYNWSNSSTDATISTSSSGTYSLICTNDIGCTDTSNVINILFNQPTPIIASLTMDSICYGTNSILNLSGAGLFVISPTIYSTQVNNQQFILNPESTTQYHIQAITQTSCNSSIDIPLYVHPLPIVNAGSDTTVLTGSSIILGGSPSANGIGPFSYLWQPGYILNDSTISNPVALPNTNTSLVLFVTDFHGCNNNDTIHLQVTNSTGISQLKESGEIKYYPNPTKGIISIEGISLKHEAFQLVVYNSLGQHIYSTNIKDEDISNGVYSFDLSSFKDGFYTLQLKSQSSLHHFKIIKSNN